MAFSEKKLKKYCDLVDVQVFKELADKVNGQKETAAENKNCNVKRNVMKIK